MSHEQFPTARQHHRRHHARRTPRPTPSASRWRQAGATVYSYPAIRIVAPRDIEPLDEALRQAESGAFGWLVLTSANTRSTPWPNGCDDLSLDVPFAGCEGCGHWAEHGRGGAGAARSIRRMWCRRRTSPRGWRKRWTLGMARASSCRSPPLRGPVLADALRSAGAEVTAVDAYRTGIGQGGDDVPLLLWQGADRRHHLYQRVDGANVQKAH